MAMRSAGVIGFFIDAAGRLRDKFGRFANRQKYRAALNARRIGGKFRSKAYIARARAANKEYNVRWGAPRGRLSWVELITKYPDRFDDYIDDVGF